jgi:hypothetical protein
MTLDRGEFIRRFLIHVLPDGFHRIRYYGFPGNCHRARTLARCRELPGMALLAPTADPRAGYRPGCAERRAVTPAVAARPCALILPTSHCSHFFVSVLAPYYQYMQIFTMIQAYADIPPADG